MSKKKFANKTPEQIVAEAIAAEERKQKEFNEEYNRDLSGLSELNAGVSFSDSQAKAFKQVNPDENIRGRKLLLI